MIAGPVMTLIAFMRWNTLSFSSLEPRVAFRIVILAILLLILGFQTTFSSFFLSILRLGWGSTKADSYKQLREIEYSIQIQSCKAKILYSLIELLS